ncbi:MAG: DNA primase [bacterium]
MLEPKDEIKQRLDVVEVVQEYLPLKPAGSGSFKACCPFHNEKTPSLHVSREKQIWHCFGCDKGGDLIAFVMDIEGMSFPEALRHLGTKAGVEIPEYRPDPKSNEQQYLLDLHTLAGRFYETLLHQHNDGQIARNYIKDRGIDEVLARKFQLGYAPDRWEALATFLKNKGFDEKRLIDAGLVKRKSSGQGVIDKFRSRLMIPLSDSAGRIVGFTARLLGDDDGKKGPKYLNSPETLIYHKSDVLYGLHLAKPAIRKEKSVIIVEGNLDVVASHKAGIENVVASSGTALTESQLRQLKKLSSNLLFSFDSDAAGFAAAQRGIHLAQGMDFDIGVVAIPDEVGKDPDDVVQKSPDAWRELVLRPKHLMDYYFTESMKKFDTARVEGKRGLAHFLINEVARLHDPIDREHWLQRLGDVIHVDIGVLREMVTSTLKLNPQIRPVDNISGQIVGTQGSAKKVLRPSKIEQAAAFLVSLAASDIGLANDILSRINENQIPESWAGIYKTLNLIYTNDNSVGSTQRNIFSRLHDRLTSEGRHEEARTVTEKAISLEYVLQTLDRDQVREELNRHISILSAASDDAKRKRLEAAIRQTELSGDKERLNALINEYSKLL